MSSSCCSSAVRVRFAPSPTGNLHIGGLRTALFNWLLARHTKGVFLLRIEDTDVQRSKDEYVASIINSLEWAGITSDEPIVMQMHNAHHHVRYAKELIKQGKAYKCYCPKEEYVEGVLHPYQGTCRDKPDEQQTDYAIRLKVDPLRSLLSFDDLIRGQVCLEMSHIDDFVIVRSDGTPVYNFVVVLDDIAMGITHVIRGEEHISNTFRQLLIYEAFGIFAPQFAHLPMILGADGSKLSKRQGATCVLEYKKQGYLPEALCNYLVRLGWSYKDQEIFSVNELIELFDLTGVGAKGSIFDPVKLAWVNSVYLKSMTAEQIISYINKNLSTSWYETMMQSMQYSSLEGVIDLTKDRVHTLKELMESIEQLSKVPEYTQEELSPELKEFFEQTIADIRHSTILNHQTYQSIIKNNLNRYSLLLKIIAPHIRKALTGQTQSAGIFELMSVLSAQAVAQRFEKYIIA